MAVLVALLAIGSASGAGGAAPASGSLATPAAAATAGAANAAVPSAAGADTWDRAASVAAFEAMGFRGQESPLADGTSRWLGQGPNSSMAEVIGSGQASSVSYTTVASHDAGVALALVLNRWCPASAGWFSSQLESYDGTAEIDATQSFGDCSVHVQSLTASDGALLVTTIDR